MRIFHAEAGEQHFRITIRHVVTIAIGIEEQVGNLQDVNATMAEGKAAGQIEATDEIASARLL